MTRALTNYCYSCGCHIRKSFTLIELLVVITILTILASFIVVAANRVRISMLNHRMKFEVTSLDQAMSAFKEKFGSYPPDGTNTAALTSFLAATFPQYVGGMPSTNPLVTGGTVAALSPATALTFWLGGFQAATGTYNGLSANPANPFDNNPARIGPFFDFQALRVSNGQYFPDNGITANTTTNSPYLYFAAVNGAYAVSGYTCTRGTVSVACMPYVDTRLNNTSVNPKTFQILCPGLDGIYGTGNHYPDGTDYDPHNFDDVTNFTVKPTLQDDIP